ncbi:MAG: TrkA C-terminal domain-containing protein [Evtepia sp.]
MVILIRRGEEVIIPRGDTVLQAGDVLVINDPEDIAPDRLSPA